MSTLIQLRDVSFAYTFHSGPSAPVLQNITLAIQRGEYLAILGRNGSGKSTLARLLNGLLKPSAGQIVVDGLDTSHPVNLRDIRQRVGLVFQRPDNQLIASTVEEDVAFGPENLGIARDEMEKRVHSALTAVGMWEHRQRPPHMLSAGQKQRVAIAGILSMQPLCVVMDEATSMLDPAGRREVLHIMQELNRGGTTVVAITHHMAEAVHADRIVVLDHGTLALEGPPRQVFAQPDQLRAMGLDLPPFAALAQELHRRQAAFPAGLLTLSEIVDAARHLALERVT